MECVSQRTPAAKMTTCSHHRPSRARAARLAAQIAEIAHTSSSCPAP